MAIPPIIGNLPIFKLFKSAPAPKTAPEPAADKSTPKDVVHLSDAAKKVLESSNQIRNDGQARATASDTRDLLAEHDDLALGLRPDAPL